MSKKKRRMFESDRRMELRLRLALKRIRELENAELEKLDMMSLPERDTVDRVIEKVRSL